MTFKKIKPFIVGGATVALIATIGYNKVYLPKITHEFAMPTEKAFMQSISGVGTLEAKEVITLAPKTTSKIETLFADEGDIVTKGSILAKMELSELDANLKESSATIEKNRAQMASQRAQIADYQAKKDLADATLARYKTLIKGGYVTQAELDSVEASARSANAQLLNAKETLNQSQHEIERSIASRGALNAKVDDLSLRSSIDGIVISRDAEKGSTVNTGMSVFKIADPKKVWVKVYIDEHQAGALKVGQKAIVTLRSIKNQEFGATISRISVTSDRITEERVVYLTLDKNPDTIHLGEQAEGKIIISYYPKILTMPANTVISTKDGSGVWIEKDSKAVFYPLKVIERNSEGEVAVSGINKSQKVIIMDEREVKTGDKVRL
ncbi:efflux RND transporter periplasmic adaptor subunit [Sulfurimonas sp.]|uniref:efflux RND transporter periplasmic adaptor subunit n=1 Tax=Sulfurimonas sp. TaxID=2022749 RepID=UPI00262D567C|nr:efflux RND transporter periplasmic adaptor subunit [Sulfurimonas sp.]MDD5157178.1 efflux RND transporter periplasmic adaptor subunit [Sulfurimonas sp.]